MKYAIESLPLIIPIGKQTETGVKTICFDLSEWLVRWPGMTVSVFATRPGEAEAYPVQATVEGSVVSWHVDGYDTELAGRGCVEVLGLGPDGERKLSRKVCATLVEASSLVSTKEPGAAAPPWAVQVLSAAQTLQTELTPTAPYTHLASDGEGKAVWAPLLAYPYTAQTVILPETALTYLGDDEGAPTHMLLSPLTLEQGKTYTVIYNGVAYECPVVYIPPDQQGDGEGYALGKASVGGFEGGNEDAPFLLLHSPSWETDGYYGMLLAIDGATSVTVSITGEGTAYKTIDPEYLPAGMGRRNITLTIDADGNVTSDTDFATAWAMSAAELQAAITIKATEYAAAHTDANVSCSLQKASKAETSTGEGQIIQLEFVSYMMPDTSDGSGSVRRKTKYIDWRATGIQLGEARFDTPMLPVGAYLDGKGSGYIYWSADEQRYNMAHAGEALSVMHLTSPDGTVYRITVADDGTLTTTAV